MDGISCQNVSAYNPEMAKFLFVCGKQQIKKRRDPKTASLYFHESVEICHKLVKTGFETESAAILRNIRVRGLQFLADIYWSMGDEESTAKVVLEALEATRDSQSGLVKDAAEFGEAQCFCFNTKAVKAKGDCSDKLHSNTSCVSRLTATVMRMCGGVHGDRKVALRYAKMALRFGKSSGRECRAAILVAVGRLYFNLGLPRKATKYHRRALSTLQREASEGSSLSP